MGSSITPRRPQLERGPLATALVSAAALIAGCSAAGMAGASPSSMSPTVTVPDGAATDPASVAAPSARSVVAVAPAVRIDKGASAQGQPGCSSPACAWIRLSLSGFQPDTTYHVHLTSREGDFTVGTNDFGEVRIATDSRGAASQQLKAYYGFPGGWVGTDGDGVAGVQARTSW